MSHGKHDLHGDLQLEASLSFGLLKDFEYLRCKVQEHNIKRF